MVRIIFKTKGKSRLKGFDECMELVRMDDDFTEEDIEEFSVLLCKLTEGNRIIKIITYGYYIEEENRMEVSIFEQEDDNFPIPFNLFEDYHE